MVSWFGLLRYIFLRFCLFIHERHRERRRRPRQREKQPPCREPDMGLDPRTPGSQPEPKADAQPLSHPGAPRHIFNKDIIATVTPLTTDYLPTSPWPQKLQPGPVRIIACLRQAVEASLTSQDEEKGSRGNELFDGRKAVENH